MTKAVPERGPITAEIFLREVQPAATPIVLRGQVADWPVVKAAREGREALFAYMRRFDRGKFVGVVRGGSEIGGRLFYNEDLSGFNFGRSTAQFSQVFEILKHGVDCVAVQSELIHECLPGFEKENALTLLDNVAPRIWFGSNVIVATHHDPSENIACCGAGRRRFTLLPPDQLENLYMGPFEKSPAGATISMVNLQNPELDRYPKFAKAMEAAMVADLEPGDALYLPYHWWHNVQSLEDVNMLVNYWWDPHDKRGLARDAFLMAMLALKDLPPPVRECWRIMFEHYVFQEHGPPADHLPEANRGIAGPLSDETAARLRAVLARSLAGGGGGPR
jgi:hypothetical protein